MLFEDYFKCKLSENPPLLCNKCGEISEMTKKQVLSLYLQQLARIWLKEPVDLYLPL